MAGEEWLLKLSRRQCAPGEGFPLLSDVDGTAALSASAARDVLLYNPLQLLTWSLLELPPGLRVVGACLELEGAWAAWRCP